MSKISFEDIGNLMATFYAEEGVQDGQVVKMTGNGTVGPCGEGDAFCGVAGMPRAGIAGVQVGGFVKVPATMPMSVGMVGLVADGKGRKLATPKRKSRKHLQSVGTSAHPAAERLHRGEAVSDKEVRAVLAAFRESEFPDGPEKGIQ